MNDDDLYSVEETARLRAERPLPPPCSSCGAEASYEDDIIGHTRHHQGCEVAANIERMLAVDK